MIGQVRNIDGQGSIPVLQVSAGSTPVTNPYQELLLSLDIAKPSFARPVRKIALLGEELRRFVAWRGNYLLHGKLPEILELIRQEDPPAHELYGDLDEITVEASADKKATLLAILRNVNSLKQKANIADMLISIDEETFISKYLSPVLERKAGFLPIDIEFCNRLLNALGEEDLKAIFKNVDFNAITNTDNVGQSLSELENPRTVLNILLQVALDTGDPKFPDEEDFYKKRKIQLIALRALQKSEPLIPLPHEEEDKRVPLETLYKTSIDGNITHGAASLLITQRGMEASTIFYDVFKEKCDPDDLLKMSRRFCAINHFVAAIDEQAADELKKFILESNEVELVYVACFRLINSCGTSGKTNLISAIYEKVSKDEVSIPLAFLSSVAVEHDVFVDLLQSVFALPFNEEHGLIEAYEKASEINGCKLYINEGKYSLVTCAPNPSLLVDLLGDIGLTRLSKWFLTSPTNTNKAQSMIMDSLRSNVKSLFEHARKKDPEKINGLILGGLACPVN